MAIPQTAIQPKKRKFFPDQNGKSTLFSGLDTGIEDQPQVGGLVKENLTGMLTGSSFDPARTQTRETLARSAQSLRSQSGAANVEALGQGSGARAQGQVEQSIFQGVADTELGLNVAEQEAKERGIGFATDIAQVQQTGRIATEGFAIDRERIAEGARQFGITTEQANEQFTRSMDLEYDQLSQADKQFFATMGFNQEQFEASKLQFQQNLEQEGRLTMAQLGVEEKKIAEGGRQFDNRLDFDNSELTANLSEAEKNRVWQAIQNENANENRVDIAEMYIDQETWMQGEIDTLTRDGWTTEDARALAQQRHEENLQINDNELRREIESGRVTMADGNTFDTVQLQGLLETARQFDDRVDFEEKMLTVQAMDEYGNLLFNNDGTPKMIDRETAGRLWETNERIAQNVFLAGESDLSRQLQKQIQTGKITMADGSAFDTVQLRELLDRTMLQNDQQEFLKDMSEVQAMDEEGNPLVNDDGTPKMIDRDTANRIWQSSEAAKDRVVQANLQQLQNEFTAKGWNFQTVINQSEYLSEEQYADMLRQTAVNAGISYGATDAEDNPIVDSEGNQIQIPGFKDYGAVARLSFDEAFGKYEPGTNIKLTPDESDSIRSNIDKLAEKGTAITDTNIESTNMVDWSTSGANRWTPTNEAYIWVSDNAGKIYQASNGKLYEVVGLSNPKERHSKGGIVFRDLVSGIEFKLTRGTEFPGG